ncbi:transposase [Pseudonocardia cypriaca]|uniref:transposase n=1 Tax=Pseudonocardia cypriaca TaxID=882449 RepID=UPI003CCC581D
MTLGHGRVEPKRLRRPTADGRIVLTVDVSPWLRPDDPTRSDRLFCYVQRAKNYAQMPPGRGPFSLWPRWRRGAPSWTTLRDGVRLGSADDATAATAAQLRAVINRLIRPGIGCPTTRRSPSSTRTVERATGHQ